MSENTNTNRPIGWQADAIAKALTDTGIKFNLPNAELLAQFKEPGREITFDEGGNPFTLYDREVLPAADAFARWAADTDGVCDRRTLPRSPGGGRSVVASKADLPDYKAKAAYIAEHGGAAYEALPLTSKPTEELRYREQFRDLPLSEKTRLIAKHGAGFMETLPPRPSDQPFGGYVNHRALEKQRRINPNKK